MTAASVDLSGLGTYRAIVEERLARWHVDDIGRRFWRKDPTVWPAAPPEDVASRMGWLSLTEARGELVETFGGFADELRAEGMREAVVLGMGGSSLAPDLFARTFVPAPESLRLRVLDSTHPTAVAGLAASLDLPHTLFVVSSKSGSTIEPNSFYEFFREKVRATGGPVGRHFVAITDPGTVLARRAGTEGFRRTFSAPPDVGGRYSALTPFGLVPA
ncbi:MAG TPA: hypothetical protein VML53_02515, partial [Thermoplasmata archaeon]|nr:hypothetical protein [Thermoplasmata archaeon]